MLLVLWVFFFFIHFKYLFEGFLSNPWHWNNKCESHIILTITISSWCGHQFQLFQFCFCFISLVNLVCRLDGSKCYKTHKLRDSIVKIKSEVQVKILANQNGSSLQRGEKKNSTDIVEMISHWPSVWNWSDLNCRMYYQVHTKNHWLQLNFKLMIRHFIINEQ